MDVDGVLNGHEKHHKTRYHRIDPILAFKFDTFLEKHDAEFVLSSAWRYLVHGGSMTLLGLQNLFLSHWIDGRRLVGITRKDTMVRTGMIVRPLENERGQQISDYVQANSITNYVVIDDLDMGISRAGHPFVQTDGLFGLSQRKLWRAGELISGKDVS